MTSITCPRCGTAFFPAPGFPAATCPSCGNVAATGSKSSPPRLPPSEPFDFQSDPVDSLPSSHTRIKPGQGFGIAAMVLGVVAMCFVFAGAAVPLVGVIALPCAVLAIVFGKMGTKTEGDSMARAGVTMGYVFFILPILIGIIVVGLTGATMLGVRHQENERREQQRRWDAEEERMLELDRQKEIDRARKLKTFLEKGVLQ